MQNPNRYHGVIKYQENIIYEFHTDDTSYAIAKLARLIAEIYPHSRGELIDSSTGKNVYRSCQTAVC